jgi:multidrug transporter EmrE-like cation transporter
MSKSKNKKKYFILLHILLILYSIGGVCSKLAATQLFLSYDFFLFYFFLLSILLLYAFGWQQVIKVLPLSTAFANKAITVVWGLVLGRLLFNEDITVWKLTGICLVMIGIVLYSCSKETVGNGQ